MIYVEKKRNEKKKHKNLVEGVYRRELPACMQKTVQNVYLLLNIIRNTQLYLFLKYMILYCTDSIFNFNV